LTGGDFRQANVEFGMGTHRDRLVNDIEAIVRRLRGCTGRYQGNERNQRKSGDLTASPMIGRMTGMHGELLRQYPIFS
jgi:hypothetical protein